MNIYNEIIDSINIKCDCCCCNLEIIRYNEKLDSQHNYKYFEFSVWKLFGSDRPLSFKERIRWMWRILKTGVPWADMIIISDEKAKQISDFIKKNVS